MNFQVKILLETFVLTVVIALLVIPILKKLKIGQIEREDGPKSHLKKQGTPTMGGIIIIIAIIIMTIVSYIYYVGRSPEIANKILPLCIVAVGFGSIGLIDDFKKLVLKNTDGLKPSYKMVGLLIVSVIYVIYLIEGANLGTETYIPIIKTYITIPLWLYIPSAIFVMLATTNAINLTDGIDGLSTTVCIIIIACLTVIGITFGITEIAIFGSVLCGACLGFLMFNLNPAKVFMGDTGSLMLGGVIVAISLYLKMPLILLVIAFIPVVETLSVMIQVAYFKKTGKRVFKMAPLHHHFELSGWRESQILATFSIITLILCIIGLKII